ncbi:MAG: hypothetical protein QOI46_1362 [Alphaproteobacteria bacterium]|jgi:hypothetical protein|nr:hypothetical protein [Alphaproteobacteria bacterium]
MMVELARYTLCLRSGTKPGKVVASGLTRAEAATAIARNLYRFDICIRAADFETFRSFEMTRFPDEFDCVIASATVPKSASFDNNKAYALELIEMQILRRAETLWDGEVYTDDEYARRFSAEPSHVAERTFTKEIAYTMFEALVEKGFQVAFNRRDELEWLNVHVYRKGQQVDLRLHFGPPDHAAQEPTPSVCWNVIRSPVNVEPSQPAAIPTGAVGTRVN